MATYRVALTAGPYSWTVTDDDLPGYGLADPLVISWSLPTDAVRPAQPDPIVLQFAVIAAAAGDVRLGLGDQVECAIWFAATDLPPATSAPDVWFRGRVTDGAAEVAPGGGVLYGFTCSDQSIDLTGADVGAAVYPPQTWAARLAALTAAAAPALVPPVGSGISAGTVLPDPRIAAGVDAALWVDQRDSAPDPVLDAVTELFDQTAFTGTGAYAGNTFYRPIVAAGPGIVSGAYYPVAWDALSDRFIPSGGAPAPATFGNKGSCYGVTVSTDDRLAGVLDACTIELGSGWTAVRPDVINTGVVTWLQAAAADPAVNERTPQTTRVTEIPPPEGQVPVLSTRQTQILGLTGTAGTVTAAQNNANRLGHLMTPPFQEQNGWSPDTFVWRLDKDPIGRDSFPVIFPQTYRPMTAAGQIMRTICYVRPIVVADVPPAWNLTDPTSDRVYGQLAACRLTIEEGRPRVEFTLSPTLPETGGPAGTRNPWNNQVGTWDAQVGSWDELPPGYMAFLWDDPALPTVTWNQLCPDDTWIDYQLLRGT